MCQWQIAARCENEFGACVHEHSCCSVETAILSTSLQYPSVLQNREPKWENPMSPYKSRLFTGNHPKCLENTGFRGSVLIPRKMVNSVVYAISLKTQNQVPQGVPVRVRPPAPRRRSEVRSVQNPAAQNELPDFSSALPCSSFSTAARCAGLAVWLFLAYSRSGIPNFIKIQGKCDLFIE